MLISKGELLAIIAFSILGGMYMSNKKAMEIQMASEWKARRTRGES